MRQKAGLNPHVSVDCVVFGYAPTGLKVLLIERDGPPDDTEKQHQLPGDLIRDDEDLDTAAQRVLRELTGLDNLFLEQFSAFGHPDRARKQADLQWLRELRKEPHARVVTIGYFALIKLLDFSPHASSFAKKADWVNLNQVPPLAFDHDLILNKALTVLRNRLINSPVAFELLPKKFTLGQLQGVYEAILGQDLDKRNFRRKLLATGHLVALNEKQDNVAHKPAQLFRFDRRKYDRLHENVL